MRAIESLRASNQARLDIQRGVHVHRYCWGGDTWLREHSLHSPCTHPEPETHCRCGAQRPSNG